MGLPFFTYILRCADKSYYTGHTDDLQQRITQHVDGTLGGYTNDRRPVELVWVEEFPTRIEALEAERKIKGWSRAKKEALIRRDWAAVQRLSQRQKPFERGFCLRFHPLLRANGDLGRVPLPPFVLRRGRSRRLRSRLEAPPPNPSSSSSARNSARISARPREPC